MVSDTALQVISGQIQNLRTIDYGFTRSESLILDDDIDNNGWLNCLVSRNLFFLVWCLHLSSQNPCVYFCQIIEAKTLDEWVNLFSHESKTMRVCNSWIWPLIVCKAVSTAIIAQPQWNFQNMWVQYQSKFGI